MAKTSEAVDASLEGMYDRMRSSVPAGGDATEVDNLVYTLQSLDTVLTSVRNVRTLDVDLSQGLGWGLARAVASPSNWVAVATTTYQATRHAPSYVELMKVAASRDRRTKLLKTPEAWELLLKRNSTLREYYAENTEGMTKLIASNSGMSKEAIQEHAIPLTLNILEAAGRDAEDLAPQICNLLGNSSALNADTEVNVPQLFSDIIDISENPSLKAAFLSDENLEHISGTMVELYETRVEMRSAMTDYGVDHEAFVALQPVLKGLLKSAIEDPEKKSEILNMVSMLTGMQNEEVVDLNQTLSTIKNVLKNEDLVEALSEPRAQKAFVNSLLTTLSTTESISAYIDPKKLRNSKALGGALVDSLAMNPDMLTKFGKILDKNATNGQMLDNVFEFIKDPALQRFVLNEPEAKTQLADLVSSVLVGTSDSPGALGALGADAAATRKAVDMVLDIAGEAGGINIEALNSIQKLVQTSMNPEATTAEILTQTSEMLRNQPAHIKSQMVDAIPILVPQIAGKLIPEGYVSPETTKRFGPLLQGLVTAITDNPALVGKVAQIIDNTDGVASRLNQIAGIVGDSTLRDTLNANKEIIATAAMEAVTNQPDGSLPVPKDLITPLKPLVSSITAVIAEHPTILNDIATLASGNMNKKEFHAALSNIMSDKKLRTSIIDNKEEIAKAVLAYQIKSTLDAELGKPIPQQVVSEMVNSPMNRDFINRTAGVIDKLVASDNKVKNIGEIARLFGKSSKFKGAMQGARFAMGNAGLVSDVYKVNKALQKNIQSLREAYAPPPPPTPEKAPAKASMLRMMFTRNSTPKVEATPSVTTKRGKSEGRGR